MSSIKTTQIDGDVSIGRNLSMGGKANIQGSVHVGHNMRVDGWLEAPNIKGANKGIYLTVEELRRAYPNPHDGWLAGVGASTPFTAYVGKGGDWVASGGQIEINVDLSQYTEEVEQLRQDIIAVNGGLGSANAEIAELLKRIKGESENSSAYTDPFINMGNFDDWTALNTKLNNIDIDDKNLIKYMGRCRAKVSGVTIELYNFINNFSNKDYSQVILGNVSADANGDVTFTSDHFNIMHRQHKDGAWSPWQRINDHPLATTSVDGLMSKDDKSALNTANTAISDLRYRLQGRADMSDKCSAYTDPFISMGDITGWPEFSEKLDAISEQKNKQNYMGRCRARVNGITVEVYHFINSFSNNDFSQVVLGNVSAIKDEQDKWQVTFTPNKFNIIYRQYKKGQWLEWQRINDHPLATSSLDGLMSAADKEKSDNYPSQFVLDLGDMPTQAEGEARAASSEVAGNRNISFIRFQTKGVRAKKTTLILQWPNGDNYTAQIKFTDKAEWRRNVRDATGVAGAATAATPWERTAPHYIGYDAANRRIQFKDYTQEVSRFVELPLATSTQDGLMSAEDKNALGKASAKADTATRIMPFGGVVSNPTIETQGVASYDAIIFDDIRCMFLARKGSKYYMSFLGSEDYNASETMKARTDRLFFRTDTKSAYIFDGSKLSNLGISGDELAQLVLEIPVATETSKGLMSDEDKKKLNKTKPVEEVTWTGQHHMNAYTECGEFHIHGERTTNEDGLPILNEGTIDATLTVLDSSLPNGTDSDTGTCVTQILRLSNRKGGDGHIFIRTAQAKEKSQLASPSSSYWGTWEKLMGMFEKNQVFNLDDLDGYTTNGMYSGLYANESKDHGGIHFSTGDTFLMITVNGYAVSNFATPQITQLLYKLPAKTSTSEQNAEIYLRTGSYNKTDKVWVWGTFTKMVTNADLLEIPVATDSNNGLMSAYHVELIRQLLGKAGQYADRFVDNPLADNGNISGNPHAGLMSQYDKAKLENYPNSPFDIAPATEDSPGLMSAADKARSDNYPTQFVMDFGLVDSQAAGEQMAARSEVAGNRNISFIRFQVNGVRALRTSLILQWPNGINETAQLIFTDKAQYRRNVTGATGVAGAATTATDWERTAPHCIGYDAARRMIQLKDYTQTTWKRGEVELPLATSSQHGLMSSADKAKITELESRISDIEDQLSAAAQ